MDPQQQFCLKWNNFSSNLALTCSKLYNNDFLADVTLSCDGSTFKVHKLILAACSKKFADIFETTPTNDHCVIILEATSSENMSALLEFMYKGEVNVSQENLSSFLNSAENLQVKGLSKEDGRLATGQNLQQHQPSPPDSPSRNNIGGKGLEACDNNRRSNENNNTSSLGFDMSGQIPSGCNSKSGCDSSSTSGGQLSSYISPMYRPSKRNLRSIYAEQQLRACLLRDELRNSSNGVSPTKKLHLPSTSLSSAVTPAAETETIQSEKQIQQSSLITEDHSPCKTVSNTCGSKDITSKDSSDTPICFDQPPMIKTERNDDENCEELDETNDTETKNIEIEMENSTFLPLSPPTTSNESIDIRSHDGTTIQDSLASIAPADMLNVWNATKLNNKNSGMVNTADGKKLKCLFCDRLYGYETNLRAHIRQRHQGIRVPCPFCSRTFTRNNTVRRHIAREHKQEIGISQQSTNHNQ